MKTYQPKPIDTSSVKLSEDLMELIEMLASNTHDHWAKLRMAEGWTHGPNRNDETKQHPDLIEYEGLPESEKDYDRQTAIETLKAIITMGYNISSN